MGVFGNMGGTFGSSKSVFMVIVLAVADHLWGENVFNCPCGDYRILYTTAFLVLPPLVIIFVDTPWRVFFRLCSQCRVHFQGRCMRCCCCSRRTCEMLVRLICRPIIIGLLWLVFSCMEPKFGKCMFKQVNCTCSEAEVVKEGCTPELKTQTALIRVAMAASCLGIAALACLCGLLFIILRNCVPCTVKCCRRWLCVQHNCCQSCADVIATQKMFETKQERNCHRRLELTRSLFALGVKPQTVLKLQEEELMVESQLATLSDDSLRNLRFSLSLGQQEILRTHRHNIRFVSWLLKEGYKAKSVNAIACNIEKFGKVIDNIRTSLALTGTISPDDRQEFESQIHKVGMASLLPASVISRGYVNKAVSLAHPPSTASLPDKFVMVRSSEVLEATGYGKTRAVEEEGP